MDGYCSTGQSPQWAVAPMEEEEELYHTVYMIYPSAISATDIGRFTIFKNKVKTY
jgi:hypothetical protein